MRFMGQGFNFTAIHEALKVSKLKVIQVSELEWRDDRPNLLEASIEEPQPVLKAHDWQLLWSVANSLGVPHNLKAVLVDDATAPTADIAV